MQTTLYIILGILVVAVVAMQVWMARSQAPMAGDRGKLIRAIRGANAVLLIVGAALVAYAVFGR